MSKNTVQAIIDYIESNIEEELTMDFLSKEFGYCRYHLHKLFSLYTGLQPSQYVRSRKLEYSMVDLKQSTPIVDIAVKYGFSGSRSYSRAFKQAYGLSPSHYRNNTHKLSYKLVIDEIGGIRMLPYISETRMVELKDIYGLSATRISQNCEEDVIAHMTAYQEQNNLKSLSNFGFDVPVSEDESAIGLRGYEYWLLVDLETYDQHTPLDEVKKVHVPSSKYLAITITDPFVDPFDRIPNGWKNVWAQAEKDYEIRQDFPSCGFEEVYETVEGTFMNIYVPIK